MSPRLKISNYVIERLSNTDTNETTGCLYGLMYDGTLLVVGLSLELFENEKNTYRQLLLNLPAEIELCGVVRFGESLTTGTTMKEILQVQDDGGDIHGLSQPTVSRICARVARAIARHSDTYIKMPESLAEQQRVMREFLEIRDFPSVLGCIDCTHIKIKKYGGDAAQYYINRKGFYSLNVQDVDITDNPLVMIVNENKEMKTHFLVHDKFEETKYEVLSSDDMWKQFLHVRLNTILPLTCEATISGVKNILQNKRKKIASGQVSFHVDGTSVYLFGVASDVGLTGTSTEATIGELVDSMSPEQPKKKKHNTNTVEIVPINLVLKSTKDILSDKLVKTAVKMMTTQRKPAFCISMPLRIDTLAIIHRNTKLLELYTVLVEAACRSLRLLESILIEQLGQEGIGDGAGLRLPETFHFLPQELGHFVTRVVPKAIPDESMEKERRLLHEQLGLALNRPLFRRGNGYSDKIGGRLINPHEAISQQPLKPDVTVALVRGRYTYHHYMQDNFNDDGWGCAYRSMQTIFSWFRFQGYTTVDIPTHRDIQQCLVNIGDKQPSFLGSKQWIGSTEVMFCLETLLSVQSRIIFANTGAELQSFAHDLVHHFLTHGTPIMIGGGVLAHTILGVEYNSATNEIRYLILDPHYTGAEDLSTVVSKGWCGWKNSDFWNKTAHYNLCLPQTKPAI